MNKLPYSFIGAFDAAYRILSRPKKGVKKEYSKNVLWEQ